MGSPYLHRLVSRSGSLKDELFTGESPLTLITVKDSTVLESLETLFLDPLLLGFLDFLDDLLLPLLLKLRLQHLVLLLLELEFFWLD